MGSPDAQPATGDVDRPEERSLHDADGDLSRLDAHLEEVPVDHEQQDGPADREDEAVEGDVCGDDPVDLPGKRRLVRARSLFRLV